MAKSLTKSNRSKLLSNDAEIQLSLPVAGVLRDVRSAFLGLCLNAGKAVLTKMMEAERTALCGPKGVPDCGRSAYRGGHTQSWVVLGGRRIAVRRPRARSLESGELALPSFAWAAGADPLNAATMAAIAAGVSDRRYASTLEELPVGELQSSTSKSAVSRRFVALSSKQLDEWLSRRIEVELPVVMVDGIHFRDRVVLLALGFDSQGKKHVLGMREGSTENARVVRSLLTDMVERGLDAEAARLWVIDGGKALHRAIIEVFGTSAFIQRCQEHKRRNVLAHLPETLHASVSRAMRDAWDSTDPMLAHRQLERLAQSLARSNPGAAASLREGLEETLTLTGLGVEDALYRSLRTTNAIENLNGRIAHHTRNVKRWRDGQMVLRWVATSLYEASRGFRAVRGFRDMKRLLSALRQRVSGTTTGELKVA